MRIAEKAPTHIKHIAREPGTANRGHLPYPDKSKKKKNNGKKQSFFRKLAGLLHLWLGLISGIVIMIVALTGAIYAFQPELTDAFQPYQFVEKAAGPMLPVSRIRSIAEAQLPGKTVSRISFSGAERSVSVSFNRKKEGYYYMVYVNPYNGKVLQVKDMDRDFFRQVLNGHMHLWLPDPVGHYIIVYATLVFGLMIISGIVLWWPKKWSRSARKQSFSVKLNASPKRLNYDLHNVLGFYASWVMIFVVFTGLVWGFDAVRNAEYWVFSGGKKYPAKEKTAAAKYSPQQKVPGADPLDRIDAQIRERYNIAYGRTQFLLPSGEKGTLTVRYFPEQKRSFNADYLVFDPHTAAILPAGIRGKYADADGGDKANRMNYDIHTGAIGGFPLRLIVFLAALITASLPVTGFYIWWGKRKKKQGVSTPGSI